ncbi:hypothetical protein [uncultured Tateyamaria sp.]|uniref:hypothetical protein n=1 Tax=uncultured Tateyamaria sp. TaxID=455651 RepID=UPI00262D4D21|nr:hypothetical protein [uncultured Tateyamaria sp.]
MTMTPDHPNVPAVKAALDALISGVAGHALDVLDQVYHADMRTYLLPGGDALMQNDKAGFISHIQTALADMPDPDPWAQFHLVEANDTHGHILISRRNGVTGRMEVLTLSIDFVLEDGRWQIIREVIMSRGQAA